MIKKIVAQLDFDIRINGSFVLREAHKIFSSFPHEAHKIASCSVLWDYNLEGQRTLLWLVD